MKRAVVYFSLSGNTREAAEFIAREISADVYEIELEKQMPDNMGRQMMIGGMQTVFGMKPEIKTISADLTAYDEIILGTPIWASKAASPVNSLLKNYKISDKVTAVFTFSGGGDNDKCIGNLSKKLTNLKHNVALADRKSPLSKENAGKLEAFVTEVR